MNDCLSLGWDGLFNDREKKYFYFPIFCTTLGLTYLSNPESDYRATLRRELEIGIERPNKVSILVLFISTSPMNY